MCKILAQKIRYACIILVFGTKKETILIQYNQGADPPWYPAAKGEEESSVHQFASG